MPSSTTIIAPIFVELAPNSWLFNHKFASINAIIAALDALNALVNQFERSNILFSFQLLLTERHVLTRVQVKYQIYWRLPG
jgi:hypothetical protein